MPCYCGHNKNQHRYARDGGANSGDCTHTGCSCDSYLNPIYSYKDGRIKEKWHDNIDKSNGYHIKTISTPERESK